MVTCRGPERKGQDQATSLTSPSAPVFQKPSEALVVHPCLVTHLQLKVQVQVSLFTWTPAPAQPKQRPLSHFIDK